jgi:hypothetical protein
VTPTRQPATATATAAPAARLTFAADEWIGGYFRGDAQAYGRPWVALYGAQSAYPRATLAFALEATPTGSATLTLVGLDDEWAVANDVVVAVNGRPVFAGPGPFPDWDGVGTGADAAWTAVPFAVPADLLRTGPNEITVENRTAGANFGVPPYVLLAEASLELPPGGSFGEATGRTTAPDRAVPAAPAPVGVGFAAEDWAGGYYRGDGLAYGRPWVAVYGASSAYPRATLVFGLDAAPSGPATLTLAGLDDEWAGSVPIALEVNGQTVFSGPSPFANWDGIGDGAGAAWTTASFELPAGFLVAGRNEVAVANLAPTANFGAPPYVLLAEATLTTPGAATTEAAPERPRRGRSGRGGEGEDG